MQFTKVITSLMSAAALTALLGSAALADKIGSVSTSSPNTVNFNSSGSGGTTDTLRVDYTDGDWLPSAGHGGPHVDIYPVHFSLIATGGSSTPDPPASSNLLETFTSGTFSITSIPTLAMPSVIDYLSGTFTGATLLTPQDGLNFSSITYDPTSTSLGTDGPQGSGSLEFVFDPGFSYDTSSGYLHSFTASDSATFSGTAVPETSTIVSLGLLLMLGLGGMVVASRRKACKS